MVAIKCLLLFWSTAAYVSFCSYFADHDSQGGTVIAGFTHIAMQGVTTFSMNKGPTLRVYRIFSSCLSQGGFKV